MKIKAFDLDKVTKKFYDQFKKEHTKFFGFITGISQDFDKNWYASLMLNRLMFVYFIQKKGFLNSDINYLRNKLTEIKTMVGVNGRSPLQKPTKNANFYSFYRYFLLRLFHEGLASQIKNEELEKLLGKVPYLNGGLFEIHPLENKYPEIAITDEAFEQIFNFFDQYNWSLDDRPLKQDNEINPDVLGYIFEKYINQKQMGAYYTKEDITEYISKNCIIPYLFEPPQPPLLRGDQGGIGGLGGSSLFNLLQENGDRYIYSAVKKGVELPFPDEISAGITDVSKRENWNTPAPEKYALPTEIWREVIARRQRYLEIKTKLINGEVTSINDLITYNLNIRQFAQEAIASISDPHILLNLYQKLSKMSILDPTCGSGAFLFAALNILEPLYDGCLERMSVFVETNFDNVETYHGTSLHNDNKIIRAFQTILTTVKNHPNRQYFILKNIMLNNLYGVDIMEEATEICKLRLFLKLASQIEPFPPYQGGTKGGWNYGIEPLPDIDFNIRSGNSLVGFANYNEVEKAVKGDRQGKLDLFDNMAIINEKSQKVSEIYQTFKEVQTQSESTNFAKTKQLLQQSLVSLNEELNGYLAGEYGIDINQKKEYQNWLNSHQPFHWFTEFYSIINSGGFDVIIGNPPYIEYSEKKFTYSLNKNNFQTYPSRNLSSFVFERGKLMLKTGSRIGMIVQISSVSTPTMETMVKEIKNNVNTNWISNFATRPAYLFDGVTMNLTIIISEILKGQNKLNSTIFTSPYLRWNQEYRKYLFQNIPLTKIDNDKLLFNYAIPKLQSSQENMILTKLILQKKIINEYLESSKQVTKQELFYRTAGGRYFKLFIDRDFGSESKSNKSKYFQNKYNVYVIIAVLSSNIWWWYYTLHFDMYNCKDYMIYNFLFDYDHCKYISELELLGRQLSNNLLENAEQKTQKYVSTGERIQLIFKPSKSKPIIDKIDKILAQHYGFTDEELDFIINYDLKYRMGKGINEILI